MSNVRLEMQRSLHSQRKTRSTARSLTAPSMFSAFPQALRDQLLSLAIKRNFSSGQIIQQRGDKASGLYVIESGQVKLGRFDVDGNFRSVLVMGAGDSFGELAVLGGFARVVDVIAVDETEIQAVSSEAVDRILADNPHIARQLLRVVSTQLQEALDNIIQQRRMSTPKRMARILHTMCGDQQAPVSLAINQSDLAELIGTSRVTIAKALSNMESRGILKRGYGRVDILDIETLRSL